MFTALRRTLTGEASLDDMVDAKVIATSLTAAVVGWVVLTAAKYGIVIGETGIPLLVVVVGPPIYAAVQYAVGYLKTDPRVRGLIDFYRRNGREPGELGEPTE